MKTPLAILFSKIQWKNHLPFTKIVVLHSDKYFTRLYQLFLSNN
jgi:hypothetical protein